MILATSNTKQLANKLSKKTKRKQLSYQANNYPNGELYYRLLFKKKPATVTLIGNITANPNSIFELLALAQAAKDSKIKIKQVIIPYLAYARQDKLAKSGEAKLAEMIGTILKTMGAKKYIFVDLHSDFVRACLPAHKEILALPYLAKQLKLKFDIVVAADKGATKRAKSVAQAKKVIVMHKTRQGARTIKRTQRNYAVKGKDILIVDDMVDSGTTLLSAAKILKKQGAKSITALATHGVFSVAPEKIKKNKALDNLYFSDTLSSAAKKPACSIVDLLAH